MYEPGNLYYFKPFYFTDGTNKPKYFLSLYKDQNSVIVASLPSSVDHVPSHIDKKHGCLNDLPSDFNAYYFEKGKVITDNAWSFPIDTYLYGIWVNTYNLQALEDNYQVEGVDYEYIGRITHNELLSIISCFLSARTIKNKVKKLLIKVK